MQQSAYYLKSDAAEAVATNAQRAFRLSNCQKLLQHLLKFSHSRWCEYERVPTCLNTWVCIYPSRSAQAVAAAAPQVDVGVVADLVQRLDLAGHTLQRHHRDVGAPHQHLPSKTRGKIDEISPLDQTGPDQTVL